MVSLYVANEDGEYIEADTIPSSGYTLNTEQSYCGRSNNGEIVKDDTVSIEYENGSVNVNNITKKGTKCYLYFDEERNAGEQILANYTNLQTRTDFSTTVTASSTGKIYYADTSKGRTYYFAGKPTDNWVRFAGFYWRIIRINEDGSIRMIYNGTGTTTTYYGVYIRLVNSSKNPTFDCQNSSDLYTVASSSEGNKALDYPIGLITADEVAFAGGVYGTANQSYYLYTNSYYWTMSPYAFYAANSYARVFNVYSNGVLDGNLVNATYGVRPVINLKADTQFTGNGTVDSPFEVVS